MASSRQGFHQNLLGKRLVENKKELADGLTNRAFSYWGLSGDSVEIVGAFIKDGGVQVLVVDEKGKTSAVFVELFLLNGGE
jgi:hypothetical protein